MTADDADLVARLLAGDEAAFETVVRAWSPAMLRVARAYVRTTATAEDVVQETWVGVVRGLGAFEGRSMLRTWVFRILVNTARRRGGGEARAMAELTGPPSVDPGRFQGPDGEYPDHWRDDSAPVAPTARGPEPRALASEIATLLARALVQLPERQRAVVELRDVHGFEAAEVCDLLELSAANQRVLLHRGRSRLRGLLEGAVW